MINLHINPVNYSVSPLFLLLLIGGVIGIITFFFLIRLRHSPGVKFLMVWQIAASIWAFTYAFEFAANDIQTKILWSKLSYFGIVYCPVAFLFFSMAFASQYRWLKKKFIVLAFAFASLFILFPFTNELHHLHWKSYVIDPVTHATNYIYGPLFWIMTFFAYIAIIGAIIHIYLLYFKSPTFYRRQIFLLLVASLLPLLGNIIYIFHINPISGFDWTPFSFLFTGLLIAVNLSRFKIFELVPFARNKLIDTIPDAILVIDNAFKIADLNPAMQRLLDLNYQEWIGRSVKDQFPYSEMLRANIHQHEEFQTQVSKDNEGITHYFDLQSTALRDHNKKQTGTLIILKDITRYVDAEEKVRETNTRLWDEITEKEKLIVDLDSFSHTVAHDLKNMLGAIVSASSLVKTGIDTMTKEELLEINDLIRQAGTKTIHITQELLTLASVRQQEVKLENVNMQRIVIEAVNRLNDMILENNAQVIIPEKWPAALGYESWLEEVWINYISNAIKYGGTPPTIEMGSEILNDHRVKYWIRDNGKGLSQADMSALFNKFTRLDTLRAEGDGLGLSIVKRIIEKLNGEVGVESSHIEGEGCCFYFILNMDSSLVPKEMPIDEQLAEKTSQAQ